MPVILPYSVKSSATLTGFFTSGHENVKTMGVYKFSVSREKSGKVVFSVPHHSDVSSEVPRLV
jgi:hypothetical protein